MALAIFRPKSARAKAALAAPGQGLKCLLIKTVAKCQQHPASALAATSATAALPRRVPAGHQNARKG